MIDFLLEEGAHRDKERLYLEYVLKEEELAAMDAIVARRNGTYENAAPVYEILSDDFLNSPLIGPALHRGWKRDKAIALFSELTEPQLEALKDADLTSFLRPSALGDRLDPNLSVAWLTDGLRMNVSGLQ